MQTKTRMRTSELDQEAEHSIVAIAVFYFAFILLTATTWWVFNKFGKVDIGVWITTTDLHYLPFLPVFWAFDRRLFQRQRWRLTSLVFVGIAAGIALQAVLTLAHGVSEYSPLEIIGDVCTGPFFEELARAAMFWPLRARLGPTSAVIVTSILWALAHNLFWPAFFPQLFLTLILLRSKGSLAATTGAHAAMNSVEVFASFLVH